MASCTGATGQAGTKYTYAQLEGLWINAGGTKGLAPIMAAIAMAESGGCSAAVNPTDNGGTQTSWGLWQLSDGTHNQYIPNILSPAANASGAVAKYHAQGLQAWGTYNSGAYKGFMGASSPDLNVPAGGTGAGGGTAKDTAAIEPYSPDTCLFGFPGIHVPVAGNIGEFCLLPKHTGRAFLGILIMGAGLWIALPAVALVVIEVGLKVAGPIAAGATGAGRITSTLSRAGAAIR